MKNEYITPDIQKIIEYTKEHLPNKLTKNIEVEFRLGVYNEEGFNPDIPFELWTKIQKTLDTCDEWEKKEQIISQDQHSDNLRLTTTAHGTRICIKKESLAKINVRYNGSPFDIRISISKESSIKPDKFDEKSCTLSRIKNRTRYTYKDHYYDLTKLTIVDNTVEQKFYQIELEIINIKKSLDKKHIDYILHDSLLKINDMINMCEPVDGTLEAAA